MSENEQNDSYNDVFTLTAGAADSCPDSSASVRMTNIQKGRCRMQWLNDYRIRLVLVGVVAAILLGGGSAKADFTFGEPTNLGPTVNSSSTERMPSISADNLTLYFTSDQPGGHGNLDIWITERQTTRQMTELAWGTPINLGPTINTPSRDAHPSISLDGLTLFFSSDRPDGYGGEDLWVITRSATSEPWSEPLNLGPTVNSSSSDGGPCISADGLELFFHSNRSGGQGEQDIWLTTRTATSDPWAEPENLGQGLNSPYLDGLPEISADGLMLFFRSTKSGTYGRSDIWFSRRVTVKDDWDMPVNPGPPVNTSATDSSPNVSNDGSILYFQSTRAGGRGDYDLWQVSIEPVVDLNGDSIVDAADMCIMVDHWGTDDSLCDIGPMPWGDGIVDVQDLIVLAEHLFEDDRLIAHWKLDETEGMFAADSIGDNDAFVVGGAVWQPSSGQVDGALQLDGVDDYIIASPVLNPADNPFSIFAWVKGGGPGQVVLSQADGVSWLCMDPVEGCLMTELTKDSGRFKGDPLSSEAIINDGNWHRIGFVWDGSCRHLYVDGVEVANDTEPLSGLNDAYGGMYIGTGSSRAPGTFFSGLIDDVRIYNRAVSP